MSTKIYDAYEFKGSLDQLMSMLNEMRKKVFEAGVARCRAEIGDASKFKWYDYAEGLKKAFQSSMYETIDPKFGVLNNVTSSAVVYTYKGRLFVQFFGLPRSLKLDSKKLVDYHYQNQVDPWYDLEQYEATKRGKPKSKAWMKAQAKNYRERRRVWDALTTADPRPVHCGLVYEFIAACDNNEVAMAIFKKTTEEVKTK